MTDCKYNTFTYNNIDSSVYGLQLLYIDTKPSRALGGNLEHITYKNNRVPYNSIIDIQYNEVLEYDIEFISPYHKLDNNINEIMDWLLNQNNYRPFSYDLINKDYIINCVFINGEKIEANGEEGFGIYGIKATLRADSSFMWKNISSTFDITGDIITLENNSDVRGYTYPTLIIKTGTTGGDVTIQNASDNNRLITITNTLPNDTITISSCPRNIKSLLNDNKTIIYNNFNKHFPRLKQGINNIGVIGDVTQLRYEYKEGRLIV